MILVYGPKLTNEYFYLCFSEEEKTVELLIQYGANANAKTKENNPRFGYRRSMFTLALKPYRDPNQFICSVIQTFTLAPSSIRC